MKTKTRGFLLLLLAIVNILAWAIPSNVAKLIAKELDVLLGYYSVQKITANIFILIASLIILVFCTAKTKEILKKRVFRFLAILMVFIPGIIILDLSLRVIQQARYVGTNEIYHRVPYFSYESTYEDVPETKKSYPDVKPGYPSFPYKMNSDKRGFRNHTDLEKYDIVLLGDSFTEGSEVSDSETWAVLLEKKLEKTIYNLGMSGSDPLNYLVTFEKFGLAFEPKLVICTVYEGNDFRRTEIFDDYQQTESFSKQVISFLKASPLRHKIKSLLIDSLGGINTGSHIAEHDALAWLPIEFPIGSKHYYAFPPKRVLEHYAPYENLIKSDVCESVTFALKKLSDICKEKQIRLIIALAPSKPHVLLPLIKEQIPTKNFRDYCQIDRKKALPPADEFENNVFLYLDAKEQVIANFCQQNEIEFISYTKVLQQNLTEKQLYFTYDQHWTQDGHVLVTDYLVEYLKK